MDCHDLESYSPTQASRELLCRENDSRQAHSPTMPLMEETELESYSPTQACRDLASVAVHKPRELLKTNKCDIDVVSDMTISCKDISDLYSAVFGLYHDKNDTNLWNVRRDSFSYRTTHDSRRSSWNRRQKHQRR